MNRQQTYQDSQTSDTLEKRGDGWPASIEIALYKVLVCSSLHHYYTVG